MENLVLEITRMVEELPEKHQGAVYRFVQGLADKPPVESELSGMEAYEKLKQILHNPDKKPLADFDYEKERDEYLYEKYIRVG
ncbi:MAG: hypothetical protein FWG65_04640 [Turicibacter sp.]|nr:hypothetical protein [Turicibacter sp.]